MATTVRLGGCETVTLPPPLHCSGAGAYLPEQNQGCGDPASNADSDVGCHIDHGSPLSLQLPVCDNAGSAAAGGDVRYSDDCLLVQGRKQGCDDAATAADGDSASPLPGRDLACGDAASIADSDSGQEQTCGGADSAGHSDGDSHLSAHEQASGDAACDAPSDDSPCRSKRKRARYDAIAFSIAAGGHDHDGPRRSQRKHALAAALLPATPPPRGALGPAVGAHSPAPNGTLITQATQQQPGSSASHASAPPPASRKRGAPSAGALERKAARRAPALRPSSTSAGVALAATAPAVLSADHAGLPAHSSNGYPPAAPVCDSHAVHQALERIKLQHHSASFAQLGFNDLGALLARSEAQTLGEVASAIGMRPADAHRFCWGFGSAAREVMPSALPEAQSSS
jgi:hypothetical protein